MICNLQIFFYIEQSKLKKYFKNYFSFVLSHDDVLVLFLLCKNELQIMTGR